MPPVREDSESATGACAGEVLSQWGAGEFLLPHMITVDKEGNVWTTDVALHVATKWSPSGKKLLELGERLVPGHDRQHLCKPTQVPALYALPQLCTCFLSCSCSSDIIAPHVDWFQEMDLLVTPSGQN